ncbi:hypothetical protein [Janthinobacterium agaricidamnosum]|uniref:GDSL-like Lipase/Acylhydrolase family protein n=1 Tax=Janthinobacterium agaricidamnosum NBRC 102515 = DSM 9628 TaxID=1349767 RepID=W0VBB4_9BURK|nr:hypothetical protein [Janthinobacterium agaricidamnosum]CDG84648.1 hypothetical protein GJA_4038 [Janthinobacterium agaricidamnosum NBRC 102515 = DSM 9628]
MAYYTSPQAYFDEAYRHSGKKKFLFEGDSWFSIPDLANIPIQIDSLLDPSILCLANPGDTLAEISSGLQYQILDNLIKSERYGQQWDAIFLSAGANDIIGPRIQQFLTMPAAVSNDPRAYLNMARLNAALDEIAVMLGKIITIRNNSEINQTTPILVYPYVYLTPRPVAHKIFVWKVSGPWIYPYMIRAGIDDFTMRQQIVRYLIDRYFGLLSKLQAVPGSHFYVIDTRSALPPVSEEQMNKSTLFWNDEIHPSSRGYREITEKYFIPVLKSLGLA